MYKLLYVGSGPSVLYSALYGIEKGLVQGSDICVVEKRGRFFGDGLISDSKHLYCPSRYKGFDPKPYFKFLQENSKTETCRFIRGKSLDPDIEIELKHRMYTYEVYDALHLGTSGGLELASALVSKLEGYGVTFLKNQNVQSIVRTLMRAENGEQTKCFTVYTQDNSYLAKTVFVAVGRNGKKFVNKILGDYQVPIPERENFAIGFRLECDFNDKLDSLAKTSYDFKFYKDINEENVTNIRTFCSCPSPYSEVTRQALDGRIMFNGHADFNGKKTNRANFAIVANVFDNLENVLEETYQYTGDKGLVIENPREYDSGSAPFYLRKCITVANELTSILRLKNVKLYIPEIKRLCSVDYRIWDGLYLVGDCASVNTGIVPSAIDGIRKMEEFFGKR